MKKIIKLALSLALIYLGACQHFDEPVTTLQVGSGVNRITLSVDSDSVQDTRVDIDGSSITWRSNDYIQLARIGEDSKFVSISTYFIVMDSISEDGKSADFTGDELLLNTSYIALTGDNTTLYASGQTYEGLIGMGLNRLTQLESDDASRIESYWLTASDLFQVTDGSVPSLVLENLCSIMELDIKMDSAVDGTFDLSGISLSSSDGIFFSTGVLDTQGVLKPNVEVEVSQTIPLSCSISAEQSFKVLYPILVDESIEEVDGTFDFTITTTDGAFSIISIPARELTSGRLYTKTLEFETPIQQSDIYRAALVALYDATDGDNWTNNTNWCSEEPLTEWYGVDRSDGNGGFKMLTLTDNNLTGTLPDELSILTCLTSLDLSYNSLSGEVPSLEKLVNMDLLALNDNNFTGVIPAKGLYTMMVLKLQNNQFTSIPVDIKDMSNLWSLRLYGNSTLTGSIPEEIGYLTNLEYLYLYNNNLSGALPEQMNNLTSLTTIQLENNKLTGNVPTQFYSTQELWNEWGFYWMYDQAQQEGYGFTMPDIDIYITNTTLTTIDSKSVDTEKLFAANDITAILYWSVNEDKLSDRVIAELKDLYYSYSDDGFDVMSLVPRASSSETQLTLLKEYVSTNDIEWSVSTYNLTDNYLPYLQNILDCPTLFLVDSEGKILYRETVTTADYSNEGLDNALSVVDEARDIVDTAILGFTLSDYTSKDYSKDGQVTTLQSATEGNGSLNIVCLGDGFTDLDMEDGGKYDQRMSQAMEAIFAEEPFKTYRSRFNVYSVKAISKESGIGADKETVFSSVIDSGMSSSIDGDDDMAFTYALKVPEIDSTENLLVINVLNSYVWAGVCWMYTGDNSSVAYCPITYNNDTYFEELVRHEAGGHGFGKLLDEYGYPGTITEAEKQVFLAYKAIGWGANVDIVSDENTIQWSHMLSDAQYSSFVGVYEGALTFDEGAYRPTFTSIMRYNTDGFNAPSREAIYKRIMTLSEDGYTYTFDDFKSYDTKNLVLSPSAAQLDATTTSARIYRPTAPPVIVEGKPNVNK